MKGGDNINSKNFTIIMNILKYANGALYQKHLIKIMSKDINERQVRRYIRTLEGLGFLKIAKVDNKYNVLYITAKAYNEIFNIKKRTANTCSNYILEKNFIGSYIKYKYQNILADNLWYQVHEESVTYVQRLKDIELLRKFRDGIIMYNMYIYEHREIIKDEYVTILNLIVYKHYIQNKDIKNLIIILNKLIERYVDLEYNIMIDYKIYSLNSINMIFLEKSLENYYSKKENVSDISNKYKIECIDLRKNDYD
ncbi:hypothetical protein [Romboutsia hominis]|uniref:hypothetical protein n=1 Tax=Romboutsia hominis TaxID=1507512 RepID=UPI001F060348|nr:hypothetical protein [Romboutsia hominis]MCH1959711.1 hypothetical protein [Romboutsia hominis]MCH1969866.1 hypothetical protein [Romboutsia hominis]